MFKKGKQIREIDKEVSHVGIGVYIVVAVVLKDSRGLTMQSLEPAGLSSNPCSATSLLCEPSPNHLNFLCFSSLISKMEGVRKRIMVLTGKDVCEDSIS